jgi:hypothetical protein
MNDVVELIDWWTSRVHRDTDIRDDAGDETTEVRLPVADRLP